MIEYILGNKTRESGLGEFNGRPLQDILNSLAQSPEATLASMFAPGYALQRYGDSAAAHAHYRSVVHYLELLRAEFPELLSNTAMSKISLNHGVRLVKLRSFSAAAAALTTSIRFVETTIEFGASAESAEILATALRWLGLAQRAGGRHCSAALSYRRSAELWRTLIALSSHERSAGRRRRALAATLFGEAKNLSLLGHEELAYKRRTESSNLYKKFTGC